jgi:hypothetical protein
MLLDDLRELAKQAELEGCVVGKWLATQDIEIGETLKLLATKPGINITTTMDILKKHDPSIPFKRTSFSTHMRGTCSCQVT